MIVEKIKVDSKDSETPVMCPTGDKKDLEELLMYLGAEDLIIDIILTVNSINSLLVYSEKKRNCYALLPMKGNLYYTTVKKESTLTTPDLILYSKKTSFTPKMISEKFDSVFNDKGFIVTNTICKDVYDAF